MRNEPTLIFYTKNSASSHKMLFLKTGMSEKQFALRSNKSLLILCWREFVEPFRDTGALSKKYFELMSRNHCFTHWAGLF